MSLESLYQKYAGTADTPAPAEKWPCGPSPEPPQGQPETRMVVGAGPSGPGGPEPMQGQAVKPLAATAHEVEVMLESLHAVGHNFGEVEPLARAALLELSRAAAAELTAVLDDLFRLPQALTWHAANASAC